MKYYITLADSIDDHFYSQSSTYKKLYNAGFTNIIWNMSTRRKNKDIIHRWKCEGSSDSVIYIKLSADVEEIEELI